MIRYSFHFFFVVVINISVYCPVTVWPIHMNVVGIINWQWYFAKNWKPIITFLYISVKEILLQFWLQHSEDIVVYWKCITLYRPFLLLLDNRYDLFILFITYYYYYYYSCYFWNNKYVRALLSNWLGLICIIILCLKKKKIDIKLLFFLSMSGTIFLSFTYLYPAF